MVGRRKEAAKGEPVNGPRNGADVVTARVAEMEDLGSGQWVVGVSATSVVSRVRWRVLWVGKLVVCE